MKKFGFIIMAILLGLFLCVPAFAGTEKTKVPDLLINQEDTFIDESGKLYSFDGVDYIPLTGLSWDADNITLSMDNATVSSIKYTDPSKDFTVNLAGDNLIGDYIERSDKPVIFDATNIVITGSGDLDVVFGNDASTLGVKPVMWCVDLILDEKFSGTLSLIHNDYYGFAAAISNCLYIYGGNLYSNSEIDVTDVYIADGSLTIDVADNYASCGICTSLVDPDYVSGSFVMDGGKVKITNHSYAEDIWNGVGIWSGADVILNGGKIEIASKGKAIYTNGLIVDGAELIASSDESVVVDCIDFEAGSGSLTLESIDKNFQWPVIRTVNKPSFSGEMRIAEPEGATFEEYVSEGYNYSVVDKNKNIVTKVVIKPVKDVPKTGDSNNILIYGMAFIIALITAGFIVMNIRKRLFDR